MLFRSRQEEQIALEQEERRKEHNAEFARILQEQRKWKDEQSKARQGEVQEERTSEMAIREAKSKDD